MSKLSQWQVCITSFITWETTDENMLYTMKLFSSHVVLDKERENIQQNTYLDQVEKEVS